MGLPSLCSIQKILKKICALLLKEGESAGDHRSIPPRLGSQPALSVLCVRRRSRRVVSLPRLRFAHIRRPLMFAVRSVAPLAATLRRFRLHPLPAIRFAPSLRLPLATFPKASARPAHAARTNHCGGVCHGSASLHGTPPCFGRYEKGEASPPPLGDIKFTQSIRLPPCRECWNPTLSRPP